MDQHAQILCNDSEGASFRDPDGQLLLREGRLIRLVKSSGVSNLKAFLASSAVRQLVDSGQIVRTDVLDSAELHALLRDNNALNVLDGAMAVEHERLPFPSYPFEWPPEMLHAAGSLTLDLAEALMAEGLGLKDASPYNVLFRGSTPVFVDVLSVERREPGDSTWVAYAQFARTFLLPLLVNQRFGIPLGQLLSIRRDGIEPEEAYRLCSPLRRLLPPVLGLVSVPTWLGRRLNPDETAIYREKTGLKSDKASFILKSLFRQLRNKLNSVKSREHLSSTWSGYMAERPSYSPEEFQAKQAFLEMVLTEFHPRTVLDVGCNTGHFSLLAARKAARVVAIDADSVVVGRLWRQARAEGLDVLPLVVDLTRPTPAIGWRNRECLSFLSRARGAFEAVWMLAVLHHMLVTERIPLEEILALAAELTTSLLVIEFVGRQDPMFRRLLRGRDHLHADLTPERFEASCRRHFAILRSSQIAPHRRLYLLRKKESSALA